MKNPYEDISSRSFGHICRTCLQHNDELFMIHEINWEGIKLLEIFELTTLTVHKDDHLPQQMCKRCIKLMYQTYDFLYKCKRSEQTLNRIFQRDLKGVFEVESQIESTIDQNSQTSNPDENCSHTGVEDTSEECKNAVKKENVTEEEILYIEVVDDKTIIQNENQNELELRKKLELKRIKNLRNNGLFKCLSCAKLFSTIEEMEKHKNETHKKSFKYECEYCNSKFATNLNLRDHIRMHTKEKPFQCRICAEKFTFKSVLDRHMFTHGEDKPFKCGFCERSFTRKYVLDHHEREHTGTRLLCVYCCKEFKSRLALIRHNKNVHQFSSEADRFQCDVCGNILHSEQTFQEHLTLHGPRNFQCESCGKAFSSNRNLKTHIKMTHHDKEFACNLCDNKYKQRNSLIKHQEQHGDKFICEICSKKFVFKASLSQHLRLHRGDTKYQCKECKAICMNKRRLESHIRSFHTKEKPFSCPSCDRCFAEKTNLLNHQKLHKETLNCNVCLESFRDIDSVKAHISLYHS